MASTPSADSAQLDATIDRVVRRCTLSAAAGAAAALAFFRTPGVLPRPCLTQRNDAQWLTRPCSAATRAAALAFGAGVGVGSAFTEAAHADRLQRKQ